MKNLLLLLCAATAVSTAFAVEPRIASTSFDLNANNRLATIRYELADAPGIVTLDVQTNRTGIATADGPDWVSIGGEHLREVVGDVNRYVEDLDRLVRRAKSVAFSERQPDFWVKQTKL